MAAYRWIIDSRDEFQEERLEKLTGQKIDKCYQIGACSLTCPKGLDPRFAIEIPLLALWDRAVTVFGIPLFPLALFVTWALLIACLAWLMESSPD